MDELDENSDEFRMKSVDELTFTDDFMFGAVMRDAELCRDVLECLLRIQIGRVEYPELQKAINPSYDARGVRLDVYAEDGKRIFDVEMQTSRQRALGRRTRYYQSMIDIENLEHGENYWELKDSYVIFLCTHDPFGAGLPQYTFRNTCAENADVDFSDGTAKVIFNAAAYRNATDARIQAFLRFIKTEEPTDSLTDRLQSAVLRAKDNDKFRSDYMQFNLHEQDIRDKYTKQGKAEGLALGLERGKAQGVKQGVKQGITQTVANFVKAGASLDLISKATGLSEEEIRSLQ